MNPCDFIRACDIYVSASNKEGIPFNILEALGCRKTVVASKVKGHTDIIEDGISGFLFDLERAGELESIIKEVYSGGRSINPDEAKKRYEQFSLDAVFDKTYSTMKELIEE